MFVEDKGVFNANQLYQCITIVNLNHNEHLRTLSFDRKSDKNAVLPYGPSVRYKIIFLFSFRIDSPKSHNI